jgi:ribosomal-protein-alanine N-acetyltransferase
MQQSEVYSRRSAALRAGIGIAMSLIFHPMDEANARTLSRWHYDPPYDIYTIPASTVEEVSFLTDPHNAYYSIHNEGGVLEAFCCFGADA